VFARISGKINTFLAPLTVGPEVSPSVPLMYEPMVSLRDQIGVKT